MVDIKCLACDDILELPKFIDTLNYDGQIVCPKCKAILYIKLVKEKARKYKIIEKIRPESEPVRIVEIHQQETGQPFRQVIPRKK